MKKINKKLKAVLFDHDGTLVDSEMVHFEMWVSILQKFGHTLSLEQYIKYYAGVPTVANAKSMVDRYQINEIPIVLEQDKHRKTEEFLRQQAFPLMPGAKQTITRLHQHNLQLGIVTGAGRNGVDATIRKHCLDSLSIVISGDDVPNSKPAPDCYLLALERLAVNADECIAIEDTEHGIAAASGAGIPCIGIPNATSIHHDFSRAIRTVENLDEATSWIVDHNLPER